MSNPIYAQLRKELRDYMSESGRGQRGDVFEARQPEGDGRNPKAWGDCMRRVFLQKGWLVSVAVHKDKAVVTLRCRV